MLNWRPISEMPTDEDFFGNIIVGWQIDMPEVGKWWEFDTDDLNPDATHFAIFNSPDKIQ